MSHPLSPSNLTQQDAQVLPSQGSQAPDAGQEPKPSDTVIASSTIGGTQVESRYEKHADAAGNLVERREEVIKDKKQQWANIRYWAVRIITYLLCALEIILLLRLVFMLLGANQDNGFITFLYHLSRPFMLPFSGIFSDLNLAKNSVFESSTLIAMVIYALLAWGLLALINLIFRGAAQTGPQRTIYVRHRFW